MKRLLFSGLALMATLASVAAPITPDQALARLKNGSSRMPALDMRNPELKFSMNAFNGDPSLYIFNKADKKGFFILSADDCVMPLLGYSDNGSFDENNIPPALKYWLEAYSNQISYLQGVSILTPDYDGSAIDNLPDWDVIEPLVKSKWNQNAPYNELCPTSGQNHCYTGCVATSMSQLMYYFKYPDIGHGSISYQCQTLNKKLTYNFANAPFEWDKMLDSYSGNNYTAEQAQAVAILNAAAGHSVQMQYSTNVSGAVSMRIGGAMTSYFDYDKGATYLDRSDYTYNEWAELLYKNIKEIGPVIYDGTAPLSGGHSFLCDGYDGHGYFHFNWGWGGMSDGYYTIDVLNPSSIGIGGYAGGFNFDQDAWFGLQPNQGTEVNINHQLKQMGNVFGKISGSKLTIGLESGGLYNGWIYNGFDETHFSIGLKIEPTDGSAEPKYYNLPGYSNIGLGNGAYIPYDPPTYSGPSITLRATYLNGENPCKVTVVYKDTDTPGADWEPVICNVGFNNSFLLWMEGLEYKVENFPVDKFETSDLNLTSTLYYGCPVGVSAKISNNSEIQMTRGVCMVLLDKENQIQFMGDSFLLTLDPGESIEKNWVSTLNATQDNEIKQDTEFYLGLYDLETEMFYMINEEPVMMAPNPGAPTIMAFFGINNGEKEGNVSVFWEEANIEIKGSISLSRGYFAYPVTMHIMELRGSQYASLVNKSFDEVPFINVGETVDLEMTMEFSNPVPNKTYYILGSFVRGNTNVWMNTNSPAEFKVVFAGIDEVTDDVAGPLFFHDKANQNLSVMANAGVESVTAYDMNGKRINLHIAYNGNNAEIDLSNLGKGIIIVQAIDGKGDMNSIKIAL